MDTPPNFFGEAADLDSPGMIDDGSCAGPQDNMAVGISQYMSQPWPMSGHDPLTAVTDPWMSAQAATSEPAAEATYHADDMSRQLTSANRSDPTTRTRTSLSSVASTSKSSTRTGSASSAEARHSTSSKSTAPSEEELQPPKRKKGGKSARAKVQGTNHVAEANKGNGHVEGKRDKFLERNRVAASKCRQRKKEWMLDLQDTKDDLELRNSQLQMEYGGLVNEISHMKNELMAHASCDDPNINMWIENEARRFVQSEAGRISVSQVMKGNTMPSVPRIPEMTRRRQSFDGPSSSPSPVALDPNLSRSVLKAEKSTEINYDHMPDSIFEQDLVVDSAN